MATLRQQQVPRQEHVRTNSRSTLEARSGKPGKPAEREAHEQAVPKEEAAPAVKGGKLTAQYGEPPEIIKRTRGNRELLLKRGVLLGEGGFARVYTAMEVENGQTKAIKVIDKDQLQTTKNRGKLFAEIKLHQAMCHTNIVRFEECFEDDQNVYMVMEVCTNGSLLDVLKKRKRYTEPEARFYLVQLINACQYMHSRSVIHRDLKLGNLFLDHNMDLRVGDFGLAALVQFAGERKKTICGTPNYIAPEILFDRDNGHSFEVDVWSIGVILYTFLVGKPPFQTKDVKTIYKKIKDNAYAFPPNVPVSNEAVSLVSAILNTNPAERPTLAEILSHPFFHPQFPFPAAIPPSAANRAPDFSRLTPAQSSANFRRATQNYYKPASEEEEESDGDEDEEMQPPSPRKNQVVSAHAVKSVAQAQETEVRHALAPESPVSELLASARKPLVVSPARRGVGKENVKRSASLKSTRVDQLRGVEKKEVQPPLQRTSPAGARASKEAPAPQPQSTELYESCRRTLEGALNAQNMNALNAIPAPTDLDTPRVFITSWIDYTHKYGTAYQLTDGTSGIYFNDSTTMVLSPNKSHLDYINRKGSVYSRRNHKIDEEFSQEMERKVYLLKYFQEYMTRTLEREAEWTFMDTGRTKNLDFLVKYYRMKNAIVFKLSNEVLQINFFDHHKVLLTQNASVLTFIGPDYKLKTYSLNSLMREAAKLNLLGLSPTDPNFGQVPDEGMNPDPKRVKKQQSVSFMLTKLTFCLEVVKGLSARRQARTKVTA